MKTYLLGAVAALAMNAAPALARPFTPADMVSLNRVAAPAVSPDGKSIVFLSYDPSVTTHAANKDIALRILSLADGKVRTLVNPVGGDGTMNVANWSPDSKNITFVSYQMLPADDNGSTQ